MSEWRDDGRLAELLSLPDDDPRRREAEKDPAFRALVASYRSFATEGPAPEGADVADARRRLDAALAAEIGSGSVSRPPLDTPSVWDRLREALRAPSMRPALAMAGVIVIAGSVYLGLGRSGGPDGPIGTFEGEAFHVPALRGAETGGVLVDAKVVDDGGVNLAWRPVPGADAYVVRLLTPDHVEIARRGPVSVTTMVLTPAELPAAMASHPAVLWQVIATDQGATVRQSEYGAFRP